MTYNSSTLLNQLSESQSQHAASVNAALASVSSAALYGIKSVSGLVVTVYGGVLPISDTPTIIADQSVTLTANDTNYLYYTSSGTLTKTTSIPSGWPGPLSAGAVALYELTTNATSIIDDNTSISWRVGTGPPGPPGATGPQGNPGSDFEETRKHLWMTTGGGSTTAG